MVVYSCMRVGPCPRQCEFGCMCMCGCVGGCVCFVCTRSTSDRDVTPREIATAQSRPGSELTTQGLYPHITSRTRTTACHRGQLPREGRGRSSTVLKQAPRPALRNGPHDVPRRKFLVDLASLLPPTKAGDGSTRNAGPKLWPKC